LTAGAGQQFARAHRGVEAQPIAFVDALLLQSTLGLAIDRHADRRHARSDHNPCEAEGGGDQRRVARSHVHHTEQQHPRDSDNPEGMPTNSSVSRL